MPGTRIAAKPFSPFAYVALALAATLAALLAVRTLEFNLGDSFPISLYIVVELLVSGAVLYVGGWALLSLEELRRPRVLDHLRRCAFLYLVFVPLGILLAVFVGLDDPGGGGVLALAFCAVAGYAILIDALLLFIVRRRPNRLRTGSHT